MVHKSPCPPICLKCSMGRQGRWVPPSPGHLYPSRCVFVCVAYAYILLGRLGRPRQGGNDRYRSTTHNTVVADQYDYKGGHEGGSESPCLAPYAHWVGFVCMGVPQVPPGHPKQGGNGRYRSITHDPVVVDHQNYIPLDSP